jgi:hypothetical protein
VSRKIKSFEVSNFGGHMIPLWKGKNPIYFGVIRSKVKVTVTMNIIFDNRSFPHDKFSSCGSGKTLFIFGRF